MIETYCRPLLQRIIFTPAAKQLAKLRWLQPNTVTSLSGVFGVFAAILIAYQQVWLSIALLLLSGACDVLDGSLARQTHHQTDFGCVLDIMMDRLVEAAITIGLVTQSIDHRALLGLLMFASILLCITSFLVVGIFSEQQKSGKSFHYSPGLMERAEAFAFFIAMILLPTWFKGLAITFCLLVIATTVIRLRQFYQQQASR